MGKEGITLNEENFVKLAESAMNELFYTKDNRRPNVLTTSQIRNILSMVSEIYNDILNTHDQNIEGDIKLRIQYLKIRCVYEAGRDKKVENFIKSSNVIDYIDKIDSKKDFILFSKYMEALVAYHRYKGGKD